MPDLKTIRRAIGERTAELQHAVEDLRTEMEMLTSLLEIIDSADAGPADAGASKAGGRPRPTAGDRPQRARRRQTRSEQAVHLIGERPGITAGELARAMKMNPQYIYRLLPKLARTGTILRSRGWGYEFGRGRGRG